MTASQAALTECYALYPESFNDKKQFLQIYHYRKRRDLQKMWAASQTAHCTRYRKNPNDKTEAGSSSRRVAAQVLKYLESDGKNPRYTFGNGSLISNAIKPSAYFKKVSLRKRTLSSRSSIRRRGRVVAINLAKDGYMATMVPGQETTCEYDGACIASRAEIKRIKKQAPSSQGGAFAVPIYIV